MDKILKRWRDWRLKNTFLLLCGIVAFYFLAQTPAVDSFIRQLGYLGYFGALVAGFFFVSTYTAVPAGYVLFELARYNSPLEIAFFAGIGAMAGDYVIFRLFRDRVIEELKPYIARVGNRKMRDLFKTPYFAWLLPVVGAVVIASPLPDELGVSLMGISKMKSTHFLLLAYILNAAGIFLIVLAAKGLS